MTALPPCFPISHGTVPTVDEKRQLMEHGIAEGLNMTALARRAGVAPEQIAAWRLDIRAAHVAGKKSKAVRMTATPPAPIRPKKQEAHMPKSKARTREEKIELLEEQKREGLSNRVAAERAGVSENTWYAWKREFGGGVSAWKSSPEPAKQAVAAPIPAHAEPVRQVSITRPDGTRIEVGMTAGEIAALIS